MQRGTSSRELRYSERCRKRAETVCGDDSPVCEDGAGVRQAANVVKEETLQACDAEAVKEKIQLCDGSMYVSFDAPDYESTRTLETTLTEEISEEGFPEASCGNDGFGFSGMPSLCGVADGWPQVSKTECGPQSPESAISNCLAGRHEDKVQDQSEGVFLWFHGWQRK